MAESNDHKKYEVALPEEFCMAITILQELQSFTRVLVTATVAAKVTDS